LKIFLAIAIASFAGQSVARSQKVLPPPAGKLYHGFYWGGVGTDSHDPTEHDVTKQDVLRYEEAVGAKVAWIYFSDNWFESRAFPRATCDWIESLGKVPYVRLMLRSDVDQKHAEKAFALEKIAAGEFDGDLRNWAVSAKDYRGPLLVEWGTEPNGDWFSWNGRWHGRNAAGPALFVKAYRHIVDVMRDAGASNLTWVWHANWDDQPEAKWNRLENYFPGADYCDWLAVSAYGPTTPTTHEGGESLAEKLGEVLPRLRKLAPNKPVILAEFGCDIRSPVVSAPHWAAAALNELFSGKWPQLVGFCWWNEGWQNDDHKKHDSDLIILHDQKLTDVFRQALAEHRDKVQENCILPATGDAR
jgi:glycosyl hydrolase family 26